MLRVITMFTEINPALGCLCLFVLPPLFHTSTAYYTNVALIYTFTRTYTICKVHFRRLQIPAPISFISCCPLLWLLLYTRVVWVHVHTDTHLYHTTLRRTTPHHIRPVLLQCSKIAAIIYRTVYHLAFTIHLLRRRTKQLREPVGLITSEVVFVVAGHNLTSVIHVAHTSSGDVGVVVPHDALASLLLDVLDNVVMMLIRLLVPHLCSWIGYDGVFVCECVCVRVGVRAGHTCISMYERTAVFQSIN